MRNQADGNVAATAQPAQRVGVGLFGAVAPHVRMGILAALSALVILLIVSAFDGEMGTFWAFGLAFGFVLQRSRFCFASAFRDIFLLGHGRNMKGVLIGLAVATLGFAAFMAKQVPNPALGMVPPAANILPIGLHLVVGGLLFGIGMVVAGGCVSGSVYRMGEGYLASWVSFGGILLGLLVAGYTWDWWWNTQISTGPRIWLPALFGHGGAIALTLLGLLLVFLLVLWWESRAGMTIPDMPFVESDEEHFTAKLGDLYKRTFVHGWSAATGGALLGGLNVLLFITSHPWGFTGEVSRWAIGITNWLGFGPGELAGAAALPGCSLDLGDGGILHHMFFLVWGMVFGSFIAALFAKEFKIRTPRQKKRYWQAGGGGIVMGYGAGIAMGCTIGAFFSAIPSLALNGWFFAVFLAIGAWIGVQIIQRVE
ncbi:MAG: YeeE/YedE family protein [Caldilineaceae bacterium]|nr:YeeE/YedE family protein [Caldilineaceae bacterium]